MSSQQQDRHPDSTSETIRPAEVGRWLPRLTVRGRVGLNRLYTSQSWDVIYQSASVLEIYIYGQKLPVALLTNES